jgi:hypothetical protein
MTYAKRLPRVCQHCGASFLARPDQAGKYCSRRCVGEVTAQRRTYTRSTAAERFWTHVEKSGGCWLWTGSKNVQGYGTFYTGGEPNRELAHRFAYRIVVGAIPPGMAVCHRCDVPACIRPDHLFLGSMADNVRDMKGKGRHWSATGSYSPPRRGRAASIACAHCGEVVAIAPSRLGRRRYCSKRCKAEHERLAVNPS